jgi:acetyltransferase-like isoleucine patch superfamily enzyme
LPLGKVQEEGEWASSISCGKKVSKGLPKDTMVAYNGRNTPCSYEELFSSFFKRTKERLKKEPYLLIPGLVAYVRGLYYRVKFKCLFKRVRIGWHFRVYGKLSITGPGQVIIGKDCFILSQMTKMVCITTQIPDSKLTIGDHVGLNGTSIVCYDQIEIGEFSNIADAYITDSSAHPISPDRRIYSAQEMPAEKVSIGKNVWISTHVVILTGVHIGENSVVGAFSLVRNSLPPNILAAGIPARVLRVIPTSFSKEGN